MVWGDNHQQAERNTTNNTVEEGKAPRPYIISLETPGAGERVLT